MSKFTPQESSKPSQKTIFVIDDDSSVRESLGTFIKTKGFHFETYPSAEDFLLKYDRSKSGCLLLDVHLPGMTGLELQERLKIEGIYLTIIMLSSHGDIPMAVKAMRAGAFLFLEKPYKDEDLWENVLLALHEDTQQRTLEVQRQVSASRLMTLNDNEMAVMEKLIEGKPNKRIASELDIGLRTVELRRAKVYQKMNTKSLANLVRMAFLVDMFPLKTEE